MQNGTNLYLPSKRPSSGTVVIILHVQSNHSTYYLVSNTIKDFQLKFANYIHVITLNVSFVDISLSLFLTLSFTAHIESGLVLPAADHSSD